MRDYPDLLKYRRMDLGLQQKDVARILKCSPNTVSNSEKPYRETKTLVSVWYIKKFCQQFCKNPEDRADLEGKLLIQRSLHTLPRAVREQMNEALTGQSVVVTGGMPMPFRKMLAADLKDVKKTPLSFSADVLNAVVKGERLLSRDDVAKLAGELRQSPNQYLYDAGYLTDSILAFMRRSGLNHEAVDYLVAMPQKDFDLCMNIFRFALEEHSRLYGSQGILKSKGSSK